MRRGFRTVLVLALLALAAPVVMPSAARAPSAAAAPGQAAPAATALSPRNANYSIDVALDPASRTITGREVLTWRNISERATEELRFHLYWNAWRNNRSTWMRERARATGDLSQAPDDWGYMDVTAVRLVSGGPTPLVDLTGGLAFIAPDDGNPDDRTVLQVPLPEPLEPDETVTVEIAWTARIPRPFARTGAIGDFFFLAQWFPKVGVLQDGGWNAHQFHASTEFFADFGVYDVRITVPQGWVVGATGRERARSDSPAGTTTHHYVQEDVHDFAWTTSPDYLERTARFEHPRLPSVDMRLLLQPEHEGQAERHFEATRATLEHYGQWFGAYPYGHLTIVDPAWQSEAGGMEYPTLFTAGTRWLAPSGVPDPEEVVVHEAGHQFWYGIVATNEFEHAWLDEGINTFATARVMEEALPQGYYSERFFGGFVPWVFHDIPLSRVIDGDRLEGYRRAARSDIPSTASYRYEPATGRYISYNKTALWLHTLERHLGWPRLQRGLARYFAEQRFRHPTPRDLFTALSAGAGEDLTWFFDQVYRTSNVFDYAMARLTTRRDVPAGYSSSGSAGQPAVATPAAETPYRTEVLVRRHGTAIFPVAILVRFADGTEQRERWNGRERWALFTYERPAPAVSAEVDPDHVLLLDVNRRNNSLAVEPAARVAARRWAARWLIWVQDLMLTYAALV